MSNNRQAAEIFDQSAVRIRFDQTNTWGLIGDPTPEQQSVGIDYPNIQSAIDGLIGITRIPVGAMVQTVSSVSPSVPPTPVSQRVKLTITGGPATAASQQNIAGVNVSIAVGDTAAVIANKVATALDSASNIGTVTLSVNIVEYVYDDTESHPVTNGTINGVIYTSDVLTVGGEVGYFGYGNWQLLGSVEQYNRTIYNWLRVA